MRIFKKVSHSVSFGLESLLDSLENQEAVARATIREIEAGAARVRARRNAAGRELRRLEEADAELAAESDAWRQRAARLQADQDQALECLRRRRAALARREALAKRIEEQRALLDHIGADERAIEAKLGELRQREAALVSREARAKACSALGGLGPIEGVFDRWEARIEEREGWVEAPMGPDAFARRLASEEEEAELRAELAALAREEVGS